MNARKDNIGNGEIHIRNWNILGQVNLKIWWLFEKNSLFLTFDYNSCGQPSFFLENVVFLDKIDFIL